MSFTSYNDKLTYEQECPWAERDVPVTMYQQIAKTAQKYGTRPALSFQIESGQRDKAVTLSWEELHGEICRMANLLHSLDIGPEDRVAYMLPNCPEAVLAYLGGCVAGQVLPINPLLEAEQIASILRETGARVLITLAPFPRSDVAEKAAQALALAPQVKTVLTVDLAPYLGLPKRWLVPLIRPKAPQWPTGVAVRPLAPELAAQNTRLDFEDVAEDRVAAIFHTGGTTGMPKLAGHRYSGMVYNGWLGATLLFAETDVIMCPVPLFHIFACHVTMLAAVFSGAHVVFPTPQGYRGAGVMDNFWKLCERWKITFIITVPTALSALMQRPVNADISSVQAAFSGSAPLPLELYNRFSEAAGVNVVEGYGLTEATCLVSCNPPSGNKKVGSVGIPLPYTNVRILKETPVGRVDCDTNEIGEICVANPGVVPGGTYTEHLKNVGLYADDIYLRTGDLGRLDEEGYLWITGRAKDLIIRGGHNIDPAMIEEALLGHPAVAMAGAIGQPDAYAGELPCVYVELVDGAEASVQELMDHCGEHVHERAARPKHLDILDVLPKTAVGKVFKPELRKLAIARVYNEALKGAGLEAQVSEVIDDKTTGLTAIITSNAASAEEISTVLGSFTRPWRLASPSSSVS